MDKTTDLEEYFIIVQAGGLWLRPSETITSHHTLQEKPENYHRAHGNTIIYNSCTL